MTATANLPTAKVIAHDDGIRSQSQTHTSIPRIRLPDPLSLYPRLIAIGAEERIAKEMDRACNARALELRSYYERSISNAFASLADFSLAHDSGKRILDKFASLYLTNVKSWIEDAIAVYQSSRQSVKQVVDDAQNVAVSRSANRRRAFNTDYVPLLEHFFDENPFPTHADKTFLAKKSAMTYRQIHVWFQNRRNRTKRLHTTWRKRPTCERISPSCDGLRGRPSFSSLEALRSSHSNEQNSMQEIRSSDSVLHCETALAGQSSVLDKWVAPLHAFPFPYSPTCTDEQLSLEARGQMLSAFQWARRPYSGIPQPSQIDMNDLVDRFALLSVRDIYPRRSHRNRKGVWDSLAATCSITIRPLQAPHPALVKHTNIVSSFAPCAPFPIVRSLQPTSQAFTASTASPVPTLLSALSNQDISSRRKVSPLPKRFPPKSSPPCHNAIPHTPDMSFSTSSPYSSPALLVEFFREGDVISSATS